MSNSSYRLFPLGEIVTESLDDEQLDETTPTNNVKFPGTKNQQAMNMDILVIRKYRIRMNMILRIYCSLSHPLSLSPSLPPSLPLSLSPSLPLSISPSLSLFPDTNGKLE